MRVANREVQSAKISIRAYRNTMVLCDIRGPTGLGRGLEDAAMRCSGRAWGAAGLAVEELAENSLLTGRLNGVCGPAKIQDAPVPMTSSYQMKPLPESSLDWARASGNADSKSEAATQLRGTLVICSSHIEPPQRVRFPRF